MKNTGDIISILVLKSTIHCSRTAVVHNLRRAQKKWERLSRVLEREFRDNRNLVIIYVVVVQAVLLYGLETWMMKPQIGRVLGGFHHRVAHRLMGRKPQRGRDVRWVYPPLTEVM